MLINDANFDGGAAQVWHSLCDAQTMTMEKSVAENAKRLINRATKYAFLLTIAVGCSVFVETVGAAQTRTSPTAGGESLPTNIKLNAPFACGESYFVTQGYFPGAGADQTLHKDTNRTDKVNDFYAVDLVPQSSNHSIHAAAGGTVKYADWAKGGWSPFGRAVFIEHGKIAGKTYQSFYAHLSRIDVQKGQRLKAGDQIGVMGRSGDFRDDYFEAKHLHFAVYRDALFDGGPYGGHAVIPEPLGGAASLRYGTTPVNHCPTATGFENNQQGTSDDLAPQDPNHNIELPKNLPSDTDAADGEGKISSGCAISYDSNLTLARYVVLLLGLISSRRHGTRISARR